MHIKHIEISNFRKLHSVRIDLADEKTVFVGANNSGKTSAMVALRKFLVDAGDFSLNDFTLPHWRKLDDQAVDWEKAYVDDKPLPEMAWDDLMPSLDVWLHVETDELRYVKKFLPTIDWTGGLLGVRLRYEPKEPETLRRDYLACRKEAAETLLKAKLASGTATIGGDAGASPNVTAGSAAHVPPAEGEVAIVDAPVATEGDKKAAVVVPLWPQTITEYLQRRMRGSFGIKAYLLDPDLLLPPTNGEAQPQALDPLNPALDSDPLRKLIRVDEIGAQRGLGFTTGRTDDEDRTEPGGRRLSSQLRAYYSNHLDPFDKPEPKDFEALQSLEEARLAFEERLEDGFKAALAELQGLNYPGVTDPRLKLSSVIRPIEGLNHASAVQYEVPTTGADAKSAHRLPEESNGLGYQNLVSMVFGLMSFRDRWMRVGKAGAAVRDEDNFIPPLHLVLVEEPEQAGLRCTECSSALVEQRDPANTAQASMDLTCASCGEDLEHDAVIVEVVEYALAGEAYVRYKEAFESGPIFDCPNCSNTAYIDTEDSCAVCGETYEWESECVRCYAEISMEDALAGFENGVCSYCTHLMEKDD